MNPEIINVLDLAVSLQSDLDTLTARMKEIGEEAGNALQYPDQYDVFGTFKTIRSLATTGGER
jgi:hypothetical protein